MENTARTDPDTFELPDFRAAISPRWLCFFTSCLLLFSVLRGIRFPGAWTATHYLFNYSFGFTKRALIGSLFDFLGWPSLFQYPTHVFIASALLIANVVLLLQILRQWVESENELLVYGAIIFACSPAVVFLAHSIGYHDHIGLLLTLLALRIKRVSHRYLFVAVSFPIAILIHEAIFLLFYPVIFCSFLSEYLATKKAIQLFMLGILSAGLLLLTIGVNSAPLAPDQAFELYKTLQTKADFALRVDSFDVLVNSTTDNIREAVSYWRRGHTPYLVVLSFLGILPTVVFLGLTAIRSYRENSLPRVLVVSSVFACLTPFILYFFGSDTDRWHALVAILSFLMLHCISLTAPRQLRMRAVVVEGRFMLLFLVCLVLNAGGGLRLFEESEVKNFPFLPHYYYLQESWHKGELAISYPTDKAPRPDLSKVGRLYLSEKKERSTE